MPTICLLFATNNSVASCVPLKDYAACVDSLSLCLSKTLGAPIGSVLVGNKAFITRVRTKDRLYGCFSSCVATRPHTHRSLLFLVSPFRV